MKEITNPSLNDIKTANITIGLMAILWGSAVIFSTIRGENQADILRKGLEEAVSLFTQKDIK